MAMQLTEVREHIRTDLLDDERAARWSNAQVDRNIKLALSEVQEEYVEKTGGGIFLETFQLATDTAGVVDLSAHNPKIIAAVLLDSSGTFLAIPSARFVDKRSNTTVGVRNVTVRMVNRLTPPVDATDYLLQDASGNQIFAPSAFESLVCIRTAMALSVKDDVIPVSLRLRDDKLSETVFKNTVVRSFKLSKTRTNSTLWYYWDPQNRQIIVFNSTFDLRVIV